ncbi:MAG: hypothetical protein WC747_01025 [Candidatus Babeliales bacterium]
MIKTMLIFLSVLFNFSLVFCTEDQTVGQLKIGNLALPTSQQPGPLLGFGQNIVDKGDFQVFAYADYMNGCCKSFTEVWPTILYGIKDNLSLFIQQPIAAKFQQNNQVSKGLEDLLVQIEYAFYEKDKETLTNQLTFVVNMTFPTGSGIKQPPTGFGAPSYFLGLTASSMGNNWYPFASAGAILTTSSNGTKFGNQFLYECGICKNISYKSNEWIFSWMLEMHGLYKQRNTIAGSVDQNSGNNEILLGPSLWFSTQRFIMQGGISWAVYQKLFGNQINTDNYYIAVDIGWKF